jgi:hypothetical protein
MFKAFFISGALVSAFNPIAKNKNFIEYFNTLVIEGNFQNNVNASDQIFEFEIEDYYEEGITNEF